MNDPGPILVTGAAGFIGRALMARAPQLIGVSREDADLRDRAAADALFARLRPSRVIHLAAVTGGVAFHETRNVDVLVANTQIDANVVGAAAAVGVTRLVALLSSCAYPEVEDASEHDLMAGEPFAGSAGLGFSKRHLHRLCQIVSAETGHSFTTLTPVTVYGPGEPVLEGRSHVIPALIDRARQARNTSVGFTVWGTGAAVRQFLFIDDLVDLLLDEISRNTAPSSMIVAPDEGRSIAEVAHQIRGLVGVESLPRFTGQLEGQRMKRLRSQEFAVRHPDFAFTPFDEGLRRTVRSAVDGV